MLQLHSLLGTLERQTSRDSSGHFALFFDSGTHKIQRCTAYLLRPIPPQKVFGAHRMDLVFVRPPGVQAGDFVMTPDSVWYCIFLLLFSASALTDTGAKIFDCALVSTFELYATSESGNYYN